MLHALITQLPTKSRGVSFTLLNRIQGSSEPAEAHQDEGELLPSNR